MATLFERTKTRKIQRQRLLLLTFAFIAGVIFADAVSRLVFASLGQTPAEAAWNYVQLLYFCLWTAATGTALNAMLRPAPRLATLARVLSGAATGALTGFYYGGSLTNHNADWAIVGAIIGGVLAAIVVWRFTTGIVPVGAAATAAIAAYGFTFVIWSWAIAWLTTHHLFPGISLTLLALLYLGITIQNLILVCREIQRA